jgi:hypothetical protein
MDLSMNAAEIRRDQGFPALRILRNNLEIIHMGADIVISLRPAPLVNASKRRNHDIE